MKIPDIFDKAAMPKCLYQWRASYFEMKKRPYRGFRELLFCFPQSLRFDRKPFQLISDFHMAAVSAAFFCGSIFIQIGGKERMFTHKMWTRKKQDIP